MAVASPGDSDSIAAALSKVAFRVRLQRALDGASLLGIAGIALLGLGICLLKTGQPAGARASFIAAAALPLLGLILGALRPVPRLLLARLCDAAQGGDDLIASAWSFARLDPQSRSPFMRACLQQAGERAERLEATRAFPLRAPRGIRELAACALGAGALWTLEVPVAVPRPLPAPPRAQLLQQEDLEAFADQITEVTLSGTLDESAQRTADEVNALLEALADGSLDRLEALRELRRLEQELAAQQGDEARALDEALRELGERLGRGQLIDSVAEALRKADAKAASREFTQLARTLQEERQRAAEQRRLEQSLRRAAETKDSGLQARLEQKRRELERLLRRKKEEGGASSERERRLLQKKKRELERLEREQQREQQARRELERLRRRLDDAARSMQRRAQKDAASELQRAAQEMERLNQKKLSQEQHKELQRRLAQLREQISKERQQRMAQGDQRQAQQGQAQQGQAQQGQAQQGQAQGQQGRVQRLSLEQFGRLSRGQQGGKSEDGQEGKQAGDDGKRRLLMPGEGNGSRKLLMPGDGQSGAGIVQLEAAETQPRAGHGGRPQSGERATQLEAEHVDSQLSGQQGKGPTRSEIIADATSRGFASRRYQEVHSDYEKHAESVLERDEVPGGYRFYVRRYFQLIRPREESP